MCDLDRTKYSVNSVLLPLKDDIREKAELIFLTKVIFKREVEFISFVLIHQLKYFF